MLSSIGHLKAWFRGIARYEQEGRMDELFALLPPPPVLIEFVASTRHGRHDTYYPDFLDFDRKAGGAPMMKRLIAPRFLRRAAPRRQYAAVADGHDGPARPHVRERSGLPMLSGSTHQRRTRCLAPGAGKRYYTAE